MVGKIVDGVRMVWLSLDDRERFLLLYGAGVCLFLFASALATPRRSSRHDDDRQATMPVVFVVRERG